MRAVALWVVFGLGCGSSPERTAELEMAPSDDAPGLTLHVDGARASWTGGGLFLNVDARWTNETGEPLAGHTCCSGAAFDGLTLVVRDAGGVRVRRSHLEHQSPYAEPVPFALAVGDTATELVFAIDELRDRGMVDVSLEGGLSGNADFPDGYTSESVRVSIPAEPRD